MSTKVTCRYCGKKGRETKDDVAPGICPSCLDQRMAVATERLAADPDPWRAYALLREVGLTEWAARAFLDQALGEQPPDAG